MEVGPSISTKTRIGVFAMLLICLGVCGPAYSNVGWYATEEVSCEGNSSLFYAIRAGGWLNPNIDLVATAAPNGKVHVRLSVADLQAVSAAKGALVIDSHVLNATSAPKVRDLFLGSDREVPWISTAVLDLITGYVLHAETKLVTEGLFEWLKKGQQKLMLSYATVAFLTTQGGTLQEILAVYQGKDKRRHAVYTTSYSVQVGVETRTVLLYSCRYAVETRVSEFATSGPYNNKLMRQDGNHWRVFDVDSGKADSEILTYDDQDEEYFYFKVEGDPGQRRRVGFKHGPWQFLDNGMWKTLYASVDAIR